MTELRASDEQRAAMIKTLHLLGSCGRDGWGKYAGQRINECPYGKVEHCYAYQQAVRHVDIVGPALFAAGVAAATERVAEVLRDEATARAVAEAWAGPPDQAGLHLRAGWRGDQDVGPAPRPRPAWAVRHPAERRGGDVVMPRAIVYQTADDVPQLITGNRYSPHYHGDQFIRSQLIGFALRLGRRRVLSIQWRRP